MGNIQIYPPSLLGGMTEQNDNLAPAKQKEVKEKLTSGQIRFRAATQFSLKASGTLLALIAASRLGGSNSVFFSDRYYDIRGTEVPEELLGIFLAIPLSYVGNLPQGQVSSWAEQNKHETLGCAAEIGFTSAKFIADGVLLNQGLNLVSSKNLEHGSYPPLYNTPVYKSPGGIILGLAGGGFLLDLNSLRMVYNACLK